MSTTAMQVGRISHGFVTYSLLPALRLRIAALFGLLRRTSFFHFNHVIPFLSAYKSDVKFYLVTPTIISL